MGLLRKQKLKPTDVLAAILAVDGKGSRLDADMVDGYHADEIIDGAMEQVSTITSYTAAENKIPMGKGESGKLDGSWLDLSDYYTKEEIEGLNWDYLPLGGGTMQGNILIPDDVRIASANQKAKINLQESGAAGGAVNLISETATLALGDDQIYMDINGKTILNATDNQGLNFASNILHGVGEPTAATDAATKGYVDGLVGDIATLLAAI